MRMDNKVKQRLSTLLKADTDREGHCHSQGRKLLGRSHGLEFLRRPNRNRATGGNQQSRAERALFEKATNSINTKLIAGARIENFQYCN